MELKNPARYGNRSITTVIQLNEKESVEVYNQDDVRIVAELLAEKETTATACYTIYTKNEDGTYERLAPVLVPSYTKEATLSLGTKIDGVESKTFTWKLTAQKI
jgi:hypothetical protein